MMSALPLATRERVRDVNVPKYDGMALVAEFHLVTGDIPDVDTTVSVYTSGIGEEARARVIARIWRHLDNYEQHWQFDGKNAAVMAMNKATSQMGWGDLVLYRDLAKDGEL